jgi:hypothetical protein
VCSPCCTANLNPAHFNPNSDKGVYLFPFASANNQNDYILPDIFQCFHHTRKAIGKGHPQNHTIKILGLGM